MTKSNSLTDEFLFESKFLQVNGHRMHYIDVGQVDPILFIHGNPTSSYLWRNIIPYLSDRTRCIALDLIGYGKSERPNIDYRFVTHADYVTKFIQKLALKNFTLVLHDWGSALGFYYGLHRLDHIKGFAFMEAGSFFKPIPSMDEFHPVQAQGLFSTLRDPIQGPELMKRDNPFLGNMQKSVIGRTLSDQAWEYHQAPFRDPESRKPMWTFPTQFPIAGEPKEVFEIVSGYSPILQTCQTPKIMFHATPGANAPAEIVEWAKSHMKNLKTIDIGPGFHFLPEENPIKIGEELSKWYDQEIRI
jgi:haloalkane dehalogenase